MLEVFFMAGEDAAGEFRCGRFGYQLGQGRTVLADGSLEMGDEVANCSVQFLIVQVGGG